MFHLAFNSLINRAIKVLNSVLYMSADNTKIGNVAINGVNDNK